MAENTQNRSKVKKCNFFKVWDNDTTIQPGEKEGQIDVTSAQKRFYDHHRGFWENPKFLFFELYNGISVQKAQESGKDGNRKSKFEIFSKTAVVIVKPF